MKWTCNGMGQSKVYIEQSHGDLGAKQPNQSLCEVIVCVLLLLLTKLAMGGYGMCGGS